MGEGGEEMREALPVMGGRTLRALITTRYPSHGAAVLC